MSVVIPTVEVAVYLKPEKEKAKEEDVVLLRRRNGFWRRDHDDDDEERSSESSSIGAVSSSSSTAADGEEDPSGGDDEAESKPSKDSSLASLDSLEDSLPIKRGLSNYFSGKSKSFACLSDAANGEARDLVKPENPFNKRRRILMAAKSSWRSASYSALQSSLPPLLSPDHAVAEEEEDEEDEMGGSSSGGGGGGLSFPLAPFSQDDHHEGKIIKKAPRSLSLSDLQHV